MLVSKGMLNLLCRATGVVGDAWKGKPFCMAMEEFYTTTTGGYPSNQCRMRFDREFIADRLQHENDIAYPS